MCHCRPILGQSSSYRTSGNGSIIHQFQKEKLVPKAYLSHYSQVDILGGPYVILSGEDLVYVQA